MKQKRPNSYIKNPFFKLLNYLIQIHVCNDLIIEIIRLEKNKQTKNKLILYRHIAEINEYNFITKKFIQYIKKELKF